MLKSIFWFSLVTIFYTYIGYPMLLTLIAAFAKGIASRRQVGARNDTKGYPTVSIIISIFNEEDFIRGKVENCLDIDYPKDKVEILIGSDGSTDGTNAILKAFHVKNLKCFFNPVRYGKPHVVNKLVKMAKGEILFFTDARQSVEKDALKELVKNFQNENIGCASGELIYEEGKSITRRGIGAYWEYEKYLREKESDIYSMIGATGAIYTLRKSLFEPLPEDIILDDVYIPLIVVRKGYRAIFDRTAKATDAVASIPREEHRRKIRTLSGNYQIFFMMPYMLNPFRSKLALQIISHKFLRLIVPFFMIVMFLANLLLMTEPFYRLLFIAQCLFYAVALFEAVFRRRIKKIFGIPYLFCLLNFSALVGLWDFLFNKIDIKWEKAR